jgi:F-type H+-transporting ATPase subunit c
MIQAAKIIVGTGLVSLGLIWAGVGIGLVFGALIFYVNNPSLRSQLFTCGWLVFSFLLNMINNLYINIKKLLLVVFIIIFLMFILYLSLFLYYEINNPSLEDLLLDRNLASDLNLDFDFVGFLNSLWSEISPVHYCDGGSRSDLPVGQGQENPNVFHAKPNPSVGQGQSQSQENSNVAPTRARSPMGEEIVDVGIEIRKFDDHILNIRRMIDSRDPSSPMGIYERRGCSFKTYDALKLANEYERLNINDQSTFNLRKGLRILEEVREEFRTVTNREINSVNLRDLYMILRK